MELLTIILAVLLIARVFAEIAEHYGQPALVGELLAGIVIGYAAHYGGDLIGIPADFADTETFRALTDLGIFFLMLLAGLELRSGDMQGSTKEAGTIAFGGLILPFLFGLGLGQVFLPDSEYKLAQTLFIGTALALTAVPVSVRVLMDLGKLDTDVGRRIVSAAVIDDVLGLMLLAVLTAMIKSGTLPSLAGMSLLFVKVTGFFGLCWLLGKYVFPLFGRLLRRGEVPEGRFSGVLMMGLAFALLAEMLALHFIIGAFFAGLLFKKGHLGKDAYGRVEARISGLTSGFLAPIFFASIGMHVTLGALVEVPVFTLSLLTLAIIGKIVGAGLPAYMQNGDMREAAIIGTAMNGRGAVELVIVEIALRANLFAHPDPATPVIDNMFSAIVIMAIVTTVMTPLLLKPMIERADEDA